MELNSSAVPGTVGRFTIESRIGAGGMGEVFKGFDPGLKRHVAVKTLRPEMGDAEFVERLYREAQACARLQHPHIVTVYEVGEFEGGVFIAMEYLKGTSLADAITHGQLSLREKLTALVQILDALVHAHAEQVVHRDIKPRNVHLLPGGSVKLLDFGLARIESAETITMTGSVMGTPHYASPEQLRAERVDARSDVFSTGVLAYELLDGQRPFDGETITAVLIKVLNEPAAAPRGAWATSFPDLFRLVQRAMAKSPEERFQSAEEMRAALASFLDQRRDDIAAFAERATEPALEVESAHTLAPRSSSATSETVTRIRDVEPAATDVARPARGGRYLAAGAAFVVLAGLLVWQLRARAPQGTPAGGDTPALTGDQATASAVDTRPAVPNVLPTEPAAARPPADGPTPGTGRASAAAASAAPSGAAPTVAPAPTPVDQPDPAGARAIYAAASPKNTGLKWRVIQKLDTGEEVDADPAHTFHSGDRVRLAFESNIDGFLYVVMQGSSRRWAVAFPNDQINGGSNAVTAGTMYQVPDNGWFRFDDTPGTEELFVVFSRQRLAEMPGVMPRGQRRNDSVPTRAVEDLRQRLASRDLIFEKDSTARTAKGAPSQGQYVVNRDELAAAVAVTITLAHAK